MDDQDSIGMCQTGLTNATTQILEETINTKCNEIIEIDDCTVTMGVTETTAYTSQQ